MNEGNLVNGQA